MSPQRKSFPQCSSSTNQRRSSILKPPKTRQPFQDLDFNASSPEVSPESTKKRRVSFAEKKHVKEFCDHKEQGTIWDNTYEEADHNFSRSTETTNENVLSSDVDVEYSENVDIAIKEVSCNFLHKNQNIIQSRKYVIMDCNNVEISTGEIFLSSKTDVELTDVIRCSRGCSNPSMSKTIFCQDSDLDTTEAIGGIEPTVSVKTIIDSEARQIKAHPYIENVIKETDKTILFDNSDGEMKFTQVISGRTIPTSTPSNRALCQDLENNSNSLIENQTIIFENSVMDLTLEDSQSEPGLDLSENMATCSSGTAGITEQNQNIDLGNNVDVSDCEVAQTSNKTIFFNDFGCDMTEAISTIKHHVPEVDLVKDKIVVGLQTAKNISTEIYDDPRRGTNRSTESGVNDLLNKSNSTARISDLHGGHTSKLGDRTILFNDFGCEMTEVINMARVNSDHAENLVEKNDIENVIPLGLLLMNPKKDAEMQMEACGSQGISFDSKTNVESLPKVISRNNNETRFFNESGMDFTTAVTAAKNVQIDIDENYTIEREKTVIFSNCDIDITRAVGTAAYATNLEANSDEQAAPLSICLSLTDHSYGSNKLQSKNKRKTVETEANIDSGKSSNSSLNEKPEHDLIQSLVQNKSVHVANENLSNTFATSNCKRLRVADINADENSLSIHNEIETVDSQPLENNRNRTVSISPSKTEDIPKKQIEVFFDLATANDNATSSAGTYPDITEDAPTSNQGNDEDTEAEAEVEWTVKLIEDVSDEKSSFIEATLDHTNSDSETEVMELSRAYEKQQQLSLVGKNNETQSRLEPNNCLDYNDDCCFVMFTEELEKHATNDNCIWRIRSLDTEKVLIDFISKSLVVVIDLEATEEITTPRIIKDIRIISLLADSNDEDISMIHNILLKKLDCENLKRLHRTTQDIVPLLELISQRVKLLLDFMYEFDKLQDFHLINRTGNRISFRLHSYKVQLVIKITIDLEPFEEILPNDVTVECILGNIREKDIKQLINSVKKDHKFLTNYVKDIKEYIALVVEKEYIR